jgi:Tol biopolymer transport system component
VSVSSSERQGNSFSSDPSISSNGRYVAFESNATNLVSGDTNAKVDVFVRDRVGGTMRRVSVSSGGRQANGESSDPSIDGPGGLVTFESQGSNLVPGDTNRAADVFART